MPAAPLVIIFDLDGTLVDTAPDLLGALNWVLVAEGHEPVVPKDLRHIVGHGAKAMFEHALLRTGAPVGPERLASLTNRFLAYYRANIAKGSRPFPGVPETLDLLAAGGAGLGVCTNKAQDLTELLLSELKLTRHFPAIFGGGRTPYSKPDPRPVLDVVTALNGRRERAVLVGDSQIDVSAARAAGIPVIVMSYGYTPVPVAELGADVVVDNFADLPGIISGLVGKNYPD
ncbi:MAG TPA: phosphoglycolate phosphatase [Micropepsaceae bacterium]|nr:phosphoglycolate phosphatase [Micropepsaceae bacterium]